jgi:hypothetical protein
MRCATGQSVVGWDGQARVSRGACVCVVFEAYLAVWRRRKGFKDNNHTPKSHATPAPAHPALEPHPTPLWPVAHRMRTHFHPEQLLYCHMDLYKSIIDVQVLLLALNIGAE